MCLKFEMLGSQTYMKVVVSLGDVLITLHQIAVSISASEVETSVMAMVLKLLDASP